MKNTKSNVLKIATLGLGAALTACSTTAHSREAPPDTAARSPASGKIYSFKSDANGFDTRNFFYDNGEEVVAFDTQFTSEYAEASIKSLQAQIGALTPRPITYVVITHPNPDKFNGISVFRTAGAKIVASRKTVANMPGVQAYKKTM